MQQLQEAADGGKTDPEPDMDSGRATVRNVRSKCRCSCVLQFTFRRAVSCVLHRPSSQVIHCIELCFRSLRGVKVSRVSQQNNIVTVRLGTSRWGHRNSGRASRKTLSGSTPHRTSRATGRARTPRRRPSAARGVAVRGRRALGPGAARVRVVPCPKAGAARPRGPKPLSFRCCDAQPLGRVEALASR